MCSAAISMVRRSTSLGDAPSPQGYEESRSVPPERPRHNQRTQPGGCYGTDDAPYRSVGALFSQGRAVQYAPEPLTTAESVFHRITTSSASDQFST